MAHGKILDAKDRRFKMINMCVKNPGLWKQEKYFQYYNNEVLEKKEVYVILEKNKKKHYAWIKATPTKIQIKNLLNNKLTYIKPTEVYEVVTLPHVYNNGIYKVTK